VFSQLIGTRPTHERSLRGTAASIAFHGMLFATVIIASAGRDTKVFITPSSVVNIDPYREPAPDPAPATNEPPPPAPPVPTDPVPPEPTVEPTIVPDAPTVVPTDLPVPGLPTNLPTDPVTRPSGGEPGTGDPTGEPALPSGAFSAGEVDRPVAMLPRSPLPRYPDMLRSSRLEGGVRVMFIVDADGKVEMNSVRFVEATHPLFAEAVRSVLPRMRFRPAQAGNRRVRQLVEIPFGFTLAR
jgi:protein TonB